MHVGMNKWSLQRTSGPNGENCDCIFFHVQCPHRSRAMYYTDIFFSDARVRFECGQRITDGVVLKWCSVSTAIVLRLNIQRPISLKQQTYFTTHNQIERYYSPLHSIPTFTCLENKTRPRIFHCQEYTLIVLIWMKTAYGTRVL
jgi:hypothetical protein